MKGMEAAAASHALDVEHKSTQTPATVQKGGSLQKVPSNGHLEHVLAAEPVTLPHQATTPSRHKSKRRREIVTLAPVDVETFRELHNRCEAVGMKVRKSRLLVAGLHLLASMPMGKFLAVLGPLESPVNLQKVKKKKPPTPA